MTGSVKHARLYLGLQVDRKDIPYKGWVSFRYLMLNKRIRSRGINFPRRERVLVRIALDRIRLNFMELVPFYNPLNTGFRDNENGTIQWLDFTVYSHEIGMFIIQFQNTERHEHQRRAFNDKKKYIGEIKKLPILIINRQGTSQEYEIIIRMFIRKVLNAKSNASNQR